MIRTIINIDKEKCNGCGLCITACHENAMEIVDGKATLIRDDYCDGLGHCMPACPVDALSFIERIATEYDENAVFENQNSIKKGEKLHNPLDVVECQKPFSNLNQWPVQLALVPEKMPYFDNAHLLIASDCTAFSCGDFHNTFMKDKITLIFCPKLDNQEYTDKLTSIILSNNIKYITTVKMEVPCCFGIENFTQTALENTSKVIPVKHITLTLDGTIK